MTLRLTIEGIQQAQRANQQAIAAIKPSGAFGRAIKYATTQAHRYAIYNTPWDTGGLRASHRMKLQGLRGEVYIDPAAVNPRQRNARPAEYGARLHQQGMRPGVRGGIRAFYQYTVEHDGSTIGEEAIRMIVRGLP